MSTILDGLGLLLVISTPGTPFYAFLLLRRWRVHWVLKLIAVAGLAVVLLFLLFGLGIYIILRNGFDLNFG
jgi:hypothetical protein